MDSGRRHRNAPPGRGRVQLRSDTSPFRLIENARLFGRDDQIGVFAPTKDEYLNDRVHRPRVADQVKRHLETQGWALVRGRGAAGKTVLGTQLALGPLFGPTPTYYLDLAEFTGSTIPLDVPATLEAITTRADDLVLFIIDNVHLDEDVARALFNHWQTYPNGSSFLMLGRWVAAGPDPRGRAFPLDDLEPAAVVLEAGPHELAGVFNRLAQRSAEICGRGEGASGG